MTFWPISLALVAITLAVVLISLRRVDDVAIRFLVLALWLRYSLSALQEFTIVPLFGGLSINAAASFAVIGVGFRLLDKRLLAHKLIWPIYLYLGVAVMSGVLNDQTGPLSGFLIKWSYMILIMLLVLHAVRRIGCDQTLRLLVAPLAMPAVMGLISFAMGFGEYSKGDGSTSYRGGYLHEAIFSMIMFTFFSVASIVRWRQAWVRPTLACVAIAAILAANYRTAIIGLLPMLLLLGYRGFQSVIAARFRQAAIVLGCVVVASLGAYLSQNVPERLNDLAALSRLEGLDLTQPTLATKAERAVMSGRLYIWSLYLHDYVNSSEVQYLIGLGPEKWLYSKHLFVHAHNNFILDLYSVGAIGLMCLFVLYFYNIYLSATIADNHYALSLTAAQLGFLILNLATSPLIVLEGLLFYSIIFGAIWGVRTEARSGLARPVRSHRASGAWSVTPTA